MNLQLAISNNGAGTYIPVSRCGVADENFEKIRRRKEKSTMDWVGRAVRLLLFGSLILVGATVGLFLWNQHMGVMEAQAGTAPSNVIDARE